MRFGYCDGSGTHRGSKVLCVAGLVGDKDGWIDFDERWNRVLDKPEWPSRIRAFGTFNCARQREEFADWPFAERLALFGDLVGVIIDSREIQAIGSTALIDHLENCPQTILPCFNRNPLERHLKLRASIYSNASLA